jgi:hypothetical protein
MEPGAQYVRGPQCSAAFLAAAPSLPGQEVVGAATRALEQQGQLPVPVHAAQSIASGAAAATAAPAGGISWKLRHVCSLCPLFAPASAHTTRAPAGPAWTAMEKHVHCALPVAVQATAQAGPPAGGAAAVDVGHASFAWYPQFQLLVPHANASRAAPSARTSMAMQVLPLLPVQRTSHACGDGGQRTVSL